MVFHYQNALLGPNLCPSGLHKVYLIQVLKGVCCTAISQKNVESKKLDFFSGKMQKVLQKISNCSEIEYYISLVMSVCPGKLIKGNDCANREIIICCTTT